MTATTARTAAEMLRQASLTQEPCSLLSDDLRPTSVADAYAIQDATVALWGEPVAVLKAGLTTQAGLDRFGLSEPCNGQIPQSGVHADGDQLAAELFCQTPILEGEIAVRVGADGQPDAAAPAIEVATFRWVMSEGPRGFDLIADNVGASAVVLGAAIPLADAGDLNDCHISLLVNGEEKGAGSTTEIMGGPLASFGRVIAHERSRGRQPGPGTWVITGSATGMTPIGHGDSFAGDFGPLGTLSASVGHPST